MDELINKLDAHLNNIRDPFERKKFYDEMYDKYYDLYRDQITQDHKRRLYYIRKNHFEKILNFRWQKL